PTVPTSVPGADAVRPAQPASTGAATGSGPTPTGAATGSSGGGAGPTTTTTNPPAQTFSGYLSSPDDVSATYPFPGAGPVTATASWATTLALTLSISCSGLTTSKFGTSGIWVSIGGGGTGDEQCSVTLAESPSDTGPVMYSLSVAHTVG